MSREAGGTPRRRLALGVALVIVFSVAVLSVGVLSGTEVPPVAQLSAAPNTMPPPVPPPVPAPVPGPRSGLGAASRGLGLGAPDLADWEGNAALAMDDTTLAAAGIGVPNGANVFAARIFGGGESPAYAFYEAGGGAFSDGFYPASAVKLLAALGALDFVGSLGFTGDVTIDGGPTLRDFYDAAITYSSNSDYNELVRIAGVGRLNQEFLPGLGYAATIIQEPYGGEGDEVAYSPPMVLSEGDREVEVPERVGDESYGCGGSNCTSLFELADAVRRVVLDSEIPVAERFPIAPTDITGLQDALLAADAWITPGVQEALGTDALVYSKPGYVGGLDCVDDALVTAPSTGHRFLIAISVPDYEGCDLLSSLAHDVLTVLDGRGDGRAVRTDGSLVTVMDGHQVARKP